MKEFKFDVVVNDKKLQFQQFLNVKGTLSVILSDPLSKDDNT